MKRQAPPAPAAVPQAACQACHAACRAAANLNLAAPAGGEHVLLLLPAVW